MLIIAPEEFQTKTELKYVSRVCLQGVIRKILKSFSSYEWMNLPNNNIVCVQSKNNLKKCINYFWVSSSSLFQLEELEQRMQFHWNTQLCANMPSFI